MSSKDHPLRKKRSELITLAVIAVIVFGALSFFLVTNKAPHKVLPFAGLNKPDYLFSIYGKDKVGAFKNPSGIAVDKKNEVFYVVDRLNYRVIQYDLDGKEAKLVIKEPGKGKRLINPIYVDVDSKGQVYVSDTGVAGIYVFSPKGKFIKKFEPKDEKGKKMGWVPLGMAFDENDNLYVADKGLHRVLKFDTSGKLLLKFGKLKQISKIKEGGGSFYFPNDVAVGDNGDIYVADSNNYRLQQFSSKGKFKKIISTGGVPRGLAFMSGGSSKGVFAVNIIDQKVSLYGTDGNFKYQFGDGGMEDGQFSFPNDLAIDNQRIYVADSENNRVQVWSF